MRKKTWLYLLLVLFMILPPLRVNAATPDAPLPSPALGGIDTTYKNTPVTYGKVTVKKAAEKPLWGKTITIDPGHGGSDAGAVGAGGTKEKDVTLAISLELKSLLEQDGANVIMTRIKDQDVFRPNSSASQELQARADVSNNAGADLFLSIHVDSFTARDAGGTTTYYAKTGEDRRLAKSIQSNLVSQLSLYDRGPRRESMYMLKETSMPAVLAEVAFISNPAEEKALNNKAFLERAAMGIYNGIKAYYAG